MKKESELLKHQLKLKTIELANKAKENQEKNRLLLNLKEKYDQVRLNPASLPVRYGEMQRILESYLKTDDKTFEIQIDELHQEFYQKLRKKFSGISKNDLRFCAYLKMGLDSKEIAAIMHIQPSSAYINRSRLRKKLNLNIEDDLHEFLNAL